MDDMRWDQAFSYELPLDELERLVQESLTELNVRVKEMPSAEDATNRILENTLQAPLGRLAWQRTLEDLSVLLGPNPANLIGWLSFEDTADRMADAAGKVEGTSSAYLRTIVGLHGADLRKSMQAAWVSPHDWNWVNTYAFLEQISGNPQVRIEMTKVNGEEVVIETRPDAVLTLTNLFLEAMLALERPDVFTTETVEAFETRVRDLQTQLSPNRLEMSPETSDRAHTK